VELVVEPVGKAEPATLAVGEVIKFEEVWEDCRLADVWAGVLLDTEDEVVSGKAVEVCWIGTSTLEVEATAPPETGVVERPQEAPAILSVVP